MKVHRKSEINWRNIFLPVASAVEVIELAPFVCLGLWDLCCAPLCWYRTRCAPPTCVHHGAQGGPDNIPWPIMWRYGIVWRHEKTSWRCVTSQNDVVWRHEMTSWRRVTSRNDVIRQVLHAAYVYLRRAFSLEFQCEIWVSTLKTLAGLSDERVWHHFGLSIKQKMTFHVHHVWHTVNCNKNTVIDYAIEQVRNQSEFLLL